MNTVFASRWKALAWAAGVLLTAYCAVPAAEKTTESGETGQTAHQNPWALNKPAT